MGRARPHLDPGLPSCISKKTKKKKESPPKRVKESRLRQNLTASLPKATAAVFHGLAASPRVWSGSTAYYDHHFIPKLVIHQSGGESHGSSSQAIDSSLLFPHVSYCTPRLCLQITMHTLGTYLGTYLGLQLLQTTPRYRTHHRFLTVTISPAATILTCLVTKPRGAGSPPRWPGRTLLCFSATLYSARLFARKKKRRKKKEVARHAQQHFQPYTTRHS